MAILFDNSEFQVEVCEFVPGEPELVLVYGMEYSVDGEKLVELLQALQGLKLLKVDVGSDGDASFCLDLSSEKARIVETDRKETIRKIRRSLGLG